MDVIDDAGVPDPLPMARCMKGMALVAAGREDELQLMLGTVPESELFDVVTTALRVLAGWFVETRGDEAIALLEVMAGNVLAELEDLDPRTPTTQGSDPDE